jgi:hypothetical protein
MQSKMNWVTLALSLLTAGCNGYGIIAHEKVSPQKEFYLNEVDEFGKDCNEFSGNIRVNKKVVESIVYYTCAAVGPIKVLHRYDGARKTKTYQYFVAVTGGDAEFPLSADEKHLLQIIESKNRKGKYDAYRGITGFRTVTKDDDIFSIRYVSKINKKNQRR